MVACLVDRRPDIRRLEHRTIHRLIQDYRHRFQCARTQLTFRLGRLVVRFADQLAVLHEVEFIAGVQLTGAHYTGETLQMVDVILGAPDHLGGRNPLVAARTLCTESSAPTARDIGKYILIVKQLGTNYLQVYDKYLNILLNYIFTNV